MRRWRRTRARARDGARDGRCGSRFAPTAQPVRRQYRREKNQRGAVRPRPASGYDVADAREMTPTRRGRDVHARRMTSSRWDASRGRRRGRSGRRDARHGGRVSRWEGFPGVPPPRLRDARMRPARRPRRARRDGRLNAPAAVGDTLHHLARSAVGKGRAARVSAPFTTDSSARRARARSHFSSSAFTRETTV